jgi:glutaredoxin-like protein
MPLLRPEDVEFLTENFKEMVEEVTVTLTLREKPRVILPGAYTEENDDASEELKQLISEVAATTTKIKVVHQPATQGDRTPAMEFTTGKSLGKLRFYGLPAGYEMSTLVSVLLDLGAGELGVPEEVKTRLGALPKPVHVQVFVTPSCSYCPPMARAAFQLAMSCKQITTEVVECEEFPELSEKYQVRGVPMTVVDDREIIMGNKGPMALLDAIEKVSAPA